MKCPRCNIEMLKSEHEKGSVFSINKVWDGEPPNNESPYGMPVNLWTCVDCGLIQLTLVSNIGNQSIVDHPK